MSATASLKALADKVIERNRQRNQCATGELRCPDCEPSKTGPKLRGELRPFIEAATANVQGITPEQFDALLSADDREWISAGRFEVTELRCFAISFADGIRTGRIRFDPDTGELLEHGIIDPQVAA